MTDCRFPFFPLPSIWNALCFGVMPLLALVAIAFARDDDLIFHHLGYLSIWTTLANPHLVAASVLLCFSRAWILTDQLIHSNHSIFPFLAFPFLAPFAHSPGMDWIVWAGRQSSSALTPGFFPSAPP